MKKRRSGKKPSKSSLEPTKIRTMPRRPQAPAVAPAEPIAPAPPVEAKPAPMASSSSRPPPRAVALPRAWQLKPLPSRAPSVTLAVFSALLAVAVVVCRLIGIEMPTS